MDRKTRKSTVPLLTIDKDTAQWFSVDDEEEILDDKGASLPEPQPSKCTQ